MWKDFLQEGILPPGLCGNTSRWIRFFCEICSSLNQIQIDRSKEHIRFCIQLFHPPIAGFAELKNVLDDVEGILHLASNPGFLVFHVSQPTGSFTFFPLVLAVGLLFIYPERHCGEILSAADLFVVFQRAVCCITIDHFIILTQ